ncbi:MAG: hypothetical protein AAGA65_00650 [Actinomycetota bacterium]
MSDKSHDGHDYGDSPDPEQETAAPPGKLTPEESRAVFEASLAEDREEFERRKGDGLAAGKEPFDLDRFFEFYVMRSKPDEARRDVATANWERSYFQTIGREFMTVREFAEYLNEADVYDGGDMHLD